MEQYTDEEYDLFETMLDAEKYGPTYIMDVQNIVVRCLRGELKGETASIVNMPYEDLPLYINNKYYGEWLCVLIKWRLKIGK